MIFSLFTWQSRINSFQLEITKVWGPLHWQCARFLLRYCEMWNIWPDAGALAWPGCITAKVTSFSRTHFRLHTARSGDIKSFRQFFHVLNTLIICIIIRIPFKFALSWHVCLLSLPWSIFLACRSQQNEFTTVSAVIMYLGIHQLLVHV